MSTQTGRAAIKSIYDVTVIGGGIVGLAVARQLALMHPKLKMSVLEKDSELATHQSKRNSGVIHCGIYYKKGSLKSRTCIRGSKLVFEYCQQRGIPVSKCGKLILASRQDEVGVLHDLFKNAKLNRIEGIEMKSKRQIEDIQPGCDNSLEGIWSPNTAIVDWQQVALSYADDFRQSGGEIYLDFLALNIKPSGRNISVSDEGSRSIQTRSLVVCAGAYSSRMAGIFGCPAYPTIIPFRGSYYLLSDKFSKQIRTNVYPVPNTKLPFLGVHLTPRLDGSVIVGPTAELALSYEPYKGINPIQALSILCSKGLLNMMRRKDYFKAGLAELRRKLFKEIFTRDVKKFFPNIQSCDLIDTNFYGVRAQAVDRDGELIDDFLIETPTDRDLAKVLVVRNCPSPAATSSLAIAERIANTVSNSFLM